MKYFGDIAEDSTIYIPFNTFNSSGASVTFTGTTVKVYKDNATATESTAGVTLSKDHDSITGTHIVTIDTSADAFYAVGSDYSVQLQSATIDGQAVSAFIGSFSIENRFDEVDVTKIGGDAQSATDLKDFADAGYNPSTNRITGIDGTLNTFDDLENIAATDIVSGGAITTNAGAVSQVTTVTGNVNGSVGEVAEYTALVNAAADQVWDEATVGHTTAGTFGEQCKTDIDTIVTNIGTPADIDGGGATIADNLKKLADDNGGADFDATTDSQEKIANSITSGGGTPFIR